MPRQARTRSDDGRLGSRFTEPDVSVRIAATRNMDSVGSARMRFWNSVRVISPESYELTSCFNTESDIIGRVVYSANLKKRLKKEVFLAVSAQCRHWAQITHRSAPRVCRPKKCGHTSTRLLAALAHEVAILKSRDAGQILDVDKRIELKIGDKEGTIGTLQSHRAEHGC